jgi:hypothetical protein
MTFTIILQNNFIIIIYKNNYKMTNYSNLKKFLIDSKNILLALKDNDIIELANELNIKISCIDKININDINETYDIILSDLIDIKLNKLIEITKKYLILFNTQNDNEIKLFMEKNDDWIYANDDWTWENKITIIKKKEEHEKNIICVIKENYSFPNPKAFELFDYYFNNNYKIVIKNIDNVCYFIDKKNINNNVIVFVYTELLNDYDSIVLSHIKNHNELMCKIFCFPQDWWCGVPRPCEEHNPTITNLFNANNYKVIVAVDNINLLSEFNGVEYSEFKNNIICYNFWGIYNQAIIKFNAEPIKKILISGNSIFKRYPERYFLSRLKNNNIDVYEYNTNDVVNNNNNYNLVLNKYLCCFVSSVYVRNRKYKKSLNTHTILLKNYEILASGSLLLVPDYEEPYLKKIGLINGEHYLTLNFNYNNDDMNKQINILLDETNILNINKIRYNGYKYAINNLTNKKRFEELNEIFTK